MIPKLEFDPKWPQLYSFDPKSNAKIYSAKTPAILTPWIPVSGSLIPATIFALRKHSISSAPLPAVSSIYTHGINDVIYQRLMTS